jgi:tRNA (cmo5U34)-methyltransferase
MSLETNEHNASPQLRLVDKKDDLFAGQRYPKPFSFNDEVAGVFDDMVRRSIPLYCDVNRYVGDWCELFHEDGETIVDIGCSTGTALLYLGQKLSNRANLVGVDQSSAMIRQARKKLRELPSQHQLELICRDCLDYELPHASVVIMNYTLQFVPVAQRRELVKRIYDALKPGGCLFMSEKLRASHPRLQEATTFIYERFKHNQGYSHTEIARKKEALEQVLIPYSEAEHRQLLTSVGFQSVETVMKWNQFGSFVALKDE